MLRGTPAPMLFLFTIALAACAPAPRTASPSAEAPAQPAQSTANSNRPLNLAVRYEVNDLFPKRTGGAASRYTKRSFNAALALIDSASAARPYLAETLPQLNTDAWQVT